MGMKSTLVLAAILGASVAHAGPAPAADPPVSGSPVPAAQTPKAVEPGALILSIRAHALGLVQESPLPQDTRLPGLERMRAPTGEGTSRMPSATTEVARGVYITVMPACIPGVDEPLLPPPYRAPVRRR